MNAHSITYKYVCVVKKITCFITFVLGYHKMRQVGLITRIITTEPGMVKLDIKLILINNYDIAENYWNHIGYLDNH